MTTGARQGIDLVARAVVRADDVVCVESPTYVGILSSFEATGARVLGIPTDADGLDVEALERVLARYPVKLVALQTACHNPTGRHLSGERRERLLELARERSFFVLEDGVYARLTFDGDAARAAARPGAGPRRSTSTRSRRRSAAACASAGSRRAARSSTGSPP